MTKREFIRGITHWEYLLEFCYNEDCDICEDIYSASGIDRQIEQDLDDAMQSGMSWVEIRERLNGIVVTEHRYYRNDGLMVYTGLNNEDDFARYKRLVIEWMDEYGWDEEDDGDKWLEDEGQTTAMTEIDENMEVGFPVIDLISMCTNSVAEQKTVNEKRQRNEQAEIDRALAELAPLF